LAGTPLARAPQYAVSMYRVGKRQLAGLVLGGSMCAVLCGTRAPDARPQPGTPKLVCDSVARPIPVAAPPERDELLQSIKAASGAPGPDTPLFEVHASLAPAEHRHFDGKIARMEQLPTLREGQRFRITVDGKVPRDASVRGAVDDMPLQIVDDKTFELRLPAGVAVTLTVGQRLQGSILAGADARPATSKVLPRDELGPVLALREVPDGFGVQAEPATAPAATATALA